MTHRRRRAGCRAGAGAGALGESAPSGGRGDRVCGAAGGYVRRAAGVMALSTTAGALGACGPQGDAEGPAAPAGGAGQGQPLLPRGRAGGLHRARAALMQAQPQIELEYTPSPATTRR